MRGARGARESEALRKVVKNRGNLMVLRALELKRACTETRYVCNFWPFTSVPSIWSARELIAYCKSEQVPKPRDSSFSNRALMSALQRLRL
jgi:hypothetical protein